MNAIFNYIRLIVAYNFLFDTLTDIVFATYYTGHNFIKWIAFN